MSEGCLCISLIIGLNGSGLGWCLDVLRDERRVGKRHREVCDIAVGGVVEQDDGLVAGEFTEPNDKPSGPVVQHPAVSRKVDQSPGPVVAEQAAVEPVPSGGPSRRVVRLIPFSVVMSSLVKSSCSVASTLSACQMPSTDCELRLGWPGTGIPPCGVERAEADPGLGSPGRHVKDQRVRVDLAEPSPAAARDEDRYRRSLPRRADISAALSLRMR